VPAQQAAAKLVRHLSITQVEGVLQADEEWQAESKAVVLRRQLGCTQRAAAGDPPMQPAALLCKNERPGAGGRRGAALAHLWNQQAPAVDGGAGRAAAQQRGPHCRQQLRIAREPAGGIKGGGQGSGSFQAARRVGGTGAALGARSHLPAQTPVAASTASLCRRCFLLCERLDKSRFCGPVCAGHESPSPDAAVAGAAGVDAAEGGGDADGAGGVAAERKRDLPGRHQGLR
jgi:hypothetical protein